MQKQSILNQMIECLETESENYAYADIDPVILQKFMQLKKGESARPAKPEVKKISESVRQSPVSAPVANFAGLDGAATLISQENALKPPERPELDKMQMDELTMKVAECTLCGLHKTRNKSVFGDGNRNAELMFIGEGPGRDEDEQGLPFVGRAGELLTKMINAMQFTREGVYIANIVKCRPPENRNPMDEEAEKCLPYLNRQIDIVQPKVIVLLGAVPLKYMLGLTGITKIRGTWYEYKGIKIMPTLHPAYLLRNPSAKKEAWADLQKVMKFFGKKTAPKI
jgi:DNA polymerase